MRKILLTILTLTGVCLASGAAEQTFETWFKALDKNGDNELTIDELEKPRQLRGADRNADRRISFAEARRYYKDLRAKEAARNDPEIFEPWRKTENQTPPRTVESGDPLLNFRFSRDLPTGEKGPNGVLITGTECMHLEPHRGMLFATLSGWNHDGKAAPWPGASVAVKRAADARWEIEQNLGARSGRAESLASIEFTTDAAGEALDPTVSVLLCGVGGREDPGKVTVWARDDAAGKWIKTVVARVQGRGTPGVRVLFDHVDKITGVHHVFAATVDGALYRGAYDVDAPGRIAWNTAPEMAGRERRMMAAAEANGDIFLTVDLEPTEPGNGGLFRRIDGKQPEWKRVTGWKWSHPNPDHPRPWFGMRGLTKISDPENPAHDLLLGAREHPGAIDRIDPALGPGKAITTEFDVRSALMGLWDMDESAGGGMTIIAYNNMLPAIDPASGKSAHLISLGARHPDGGSRPRRPTELRASAWYLVRYAAGEYGVGRVFDPERPLPNASSGGLRATRTIQPSPFPEEKGRVWYFAGFDAFGGPTHLNTAWIYRGELPAGSAEAPSVNAGNASAPAWFDRFDRNRDGKLTADEVRQPDLLKTADRDGNGTVTREEAAASTRRGPRRRSREKPRGSTRQTAKTEVRVPLTDEALAARKKKLDAVVPGPDASAKPNVILIFADDLGYGDLSCYGGRRVQTPHIDSIAANGVRFTNGYVTASTCSPSRAGLITGRYQTRFGFEFNTAGAQTTESEQRGLEPSVPTMAEILESGGYYSGAIGKWHLGTAEHFLPTRRGFREFFGFLSGATTFWQADPSRRWKSSKWNNNGMPYNVLMRGEEPLREPETRYLTDAFADEAVEFIQRNKSRPFFLYLPFNAVHIPLEAPQSHLDRITTPPRGNDDTRRYLAMVASLDDAVGRVLEAVRSSGIEKNTLVLFLSDNGAVTSRYYGFNDPLKAGKTFLFEGGVRIPFLMQWPGRVKANVVSDTPVSSLDALPTLMRAVNLEIPEALGLDGQSLLDILDDESAGRPIASRALFWRNGPNRAVRMGRWKLLSIGEHTLLYDLNADLGETTNVAEQHPDVVEKLKAAYEAWDAEQKTPAWPSRGRTVREIDGVPYEMHL